jgi:hypothetical protein
MSTVVIIRSREIKRAITEAISHIELEGLLRGRLVAIKPNDI